MYATMIVRADTLEEMKVLKFKLDFVGFHPFTTIEFNREVGQYERQFSTRVKKDFNHEATPPPTPTVISPEPQRVTKGFAPDPNTRFTKSL